MVECYQVVKEAFLCSISSYGALQDAAADIMVKYCMEFSGIVPAWLMTQQWLMTQLLKQWDSVTRISDVMAKKN